MSSDERRDRLALLRLVYLEVVIRLEDCFLLDEHHCR